MKYATIFATLLLLWVCDLSANASDGRGCSACANSSASAPTSQLFVSLQPTPAPIAPTPAVAPAPDSGKHKGLFQRLKDRKSKKPGATPAKPATPATPPPKAPAPAPVSPPK